MKKLLGTLAIVLALSATTTAADDERHRLLVVLTSGDTETQAMTLVLANQAAADGTPVRLLLCGPAGDIALAEAPVAAREVITPTGMTVLSLLEALKGKGAPVDVCAIYLPNRKLGDEALAPGIGVARPPEVAAEMMAEGTRLFIF